MADQATLRTNGPATARPIADAGAGDGNATASRGNGAGPIALVSNIAEFGEDLLSLGELQARLAIIELKQNIESGKNCVVAVLVGVLIALGTLPVLLTGIAELLVSELSVGHTAALLSVAVVSLAVAGAIVAIAIILFRRRRFGFPLSSEELTRNLNWVRTVVLHSGRSNRQR